MFNLTTLNVVRDTVGNLFIIKYESMSGINFNNSTKNQLHLVHDKLVLHIRKNNIQIACNVVNETTDTETKQETLFVLRCKPLRRVGVRLKWISFVP